MSLCMCTSCCIGLHNRLSVVLLGLYNRTSVAILVKRTRLSCDAVNRVVSCTSVAQYGVTDR